MTLGFICESLKVLFSIRIVVSNLVLTTPPSKKFWWESYWGCKRIKPTWKSSCKPAKPSVIPSNLWVICWNKRKFACTSSIWWWLARSALIWTSPKKPYNVWWTFPSINIIICVNTSRYTVFPSNIRYFTTSFQDSLAMNRSPFAVLPSKYGPLLPPRTLN